MTRFAYKLSSLAAVLFMASSLFATRTNFNGLSGNVCVDLPEASEHHSLGTRNN